jgi:hypothetical protein
LIFESFFVDASGMKARQKVTAADEPESLRFYRPAMPLAGGEQPRDVIAVRITICPEQ